MSYLMPGRIGVSTQAAAANISGHKEVKSYVILDRKIAKEIE